MFLILKIIVKAQIYEKFKGLIQNPIYIRYKLYTKNLFFEFLEDVLTLASV